MYKTVLVNRELLQITLYAQIFRSFKVFFRFQGVYAYYVHENMLIAHYSLT